jgi:glycosyltransferase involved in cell wall biosynthesis
MLRPAVLLLGDTLRLGGTEGQFAELSVRLDRSRWDVHVGCISAQGPLRAKLESAGVSPWSCGRGSFKSPRFALAVSGLIRRLRDHRISLVHSFDFYSNLLGLIAGRLARVPVRVASQRDLGDLRPALQRRLHAFALRSATHVLTNSTVAADRLTTRQPALASRITVIRNGVDLDRFHPARGHRPRDGRTIIGVLANLRPEKGLGQFVRAAALVNREVPGTRFIVWGDGPLRGDLEALVTSLHLGDVFQLAGATREPEEALREIDVLVVPSLSEACPNVVLEGMATGLPVIGSRIGDIPALVEDGKTGFIVPPDEPATLARVIATVAKSPALAAQLGAQALQRARAELGIDRMVAATETFYARAIGSGGVSAAHAGASAGRS